MEINGKSIMILGEGISGKAAFEALRDIAKPFFYTDSFDYENSPRPDFIVTSPGIAVHPAFNYAQNNQIPCVAELELGYILNKTSVVAVTGTNGKTTVTRLIGDILSKQYKTEVCGNIGVPLCAVLKNGHEIAVAEVSSFQLERVFTFNPSIAIITNITPDHLDRHGSMAEYTALKMKIAANQSEDDFLICPLELKPLLPRLKSNIIFSDLDCSIKNDQIYFMGEAVMPLSTVKMTGEHNLKNVMQAVCAAKLSGINNQNIAQAVAEFKAEAHRTELISRAAGKNWYDDSKATNIGACLAACNSMTDSTTLILGGSGKGYEFDSLFAALPPAIKHIIIMGAVKDKLAGAAKKANVAVVEVESLEEAVKAAARCDAKNVLLSPAAASFDCFRDYKHRGEEYSRFVKLMMNER